LSESIDFTTGTTNLKVFLFFKVVLTGYCP